MAPANSSGTINPHHGPAFVLDRDAIVALHAATGQDATEQAYDATYDLVYEDYCDRAEVIMQGLISDWKQRSESSVIPGEVRMRCWSQSRVTALEEVLEDHIHAPIRDARASAEDTDDLTVTNPVISPADE